MNKTERVKVVKAMEYIARQINDESVFSHWLMTGVADGDIAYGDLNEDEPGEAEYYIGDESFRDLMDEFLYCMKMAWRVGGLYCDGIVTKRG